MSVRPEAIRTLDDGSFTVVSSDREQYPDIPVTTLHLSCASDVYEGPSNRYAGFVLYAHNRQTVWTLNGRKCRTGYVVVQDTDSPGVQRCISNSEGVVHGAVYKNVFGEQLSFRNHPKRGRKGIMIESADSVMELVYSVIELVDSNMMLVDSVMESVDSVMESLDSVMESVDIC